MAGGRFVRSRSPCTRAAPNHALEPTRQQRPLLPRSRYWARLTAGVGLTRIAGDGMRASECDGTMHAW